MDGGEECGVRRILLVWNCLTNCLGVDAYKKSEARSYLISIMALGVLRQPGESSLTHISENYVFIKTLGLSMTARLHCHRSGTQCDLGRSLVPSKLRIGM
jgi:hypothetical protein